MNNKPIWLSSSIFCDRSNWHTLLSTGILPFTRFMVKKCLLTSFSFEFNHLGGDNIRLSLLTEAELAEALAKEADIYFKSFFTENGFESGNVQLPLDVLFLPFPINSIQYGLYSPLENIDIGSENNAIYKLLSEIIIDAIGEEPVNDADVLTLSLYLHLAYTWSVVNNNIKTVDEICSEFYFTYSQSIESGEYNDLIAKEFANNKDFLQEVHSDIVERDLPNRDGNCEWLNQWEVICDNLVQRHQSAEDGQALQNIPHLINQQLGIYLNANLKARLDFFIARLLYADY